MSEIRYDANVIKQYAVNQYHRSTRLIAASCIIGGLVGAGLVVVIAAGADLIPASQTAMLILLLMGAVLGCVLGVFLGMERALDVQLRAQEALGLAQIEENIALALAMWSRHDPLVTYEVPEHHASGDQSERADFR